MHMCTGTCCVITCIILGNTCTLQLSTLETRATVVRRFPRTRDRERTDGSFRSKSGLRQKSTKIHVLHFASNAPRRLFQTQNLERTEFSKNLHVPVLHQTTSRRPLSYVLPPSTQYVPAAELTTLSHAPALPFAVCGTSLLITLVCDQRGILQLRPLIFGRFHAVRFHPLPSLRTGNPRYISTWYIARFFVAGRLVGAERRRWLHRVPPLHSTIHSQ